MRLLKTIAAAVAVMAIAAGPAIAETVTSGHIDASYGNVNTDGPDVDIWGVGGKIAAPVGDTLGVQVDAAWYNADDDYSDTNVLTGTVHLFDRNENRLLGGAVGVIRSDDDFDDTTTWGAALESDFYIGDNTTLGARAEWLTNDDANIDFWGVDAHARYFVTDNFRVEGNVGWGTIDDNGGDNVDVWGVGGEAEYRLDSVPLSVFGGVSWINVDDNFGDSSDVTVAQIGVRWAFGEDSLKARDRTGASLKPLDNLLGLAPVGGVISGVSYYVPEEPTFEE
mgnify:FL=1